MVLTLLSVDSSLSPKAVVWCLYPLNLIVPSSHRGRLTALLGNDPQGSFFTLLFWELFNLRINEFISQLGPKTKEQTFAFMMGELMAGSQACPV